MKNRIKFSCELSRKEIQRLSLFVLYFFIYTNLFSQNSTQPISSTANFTNTNNFNFSKQQFYFNYQGPDGNISYKYSPVADGSLAALQCIKDSGYTFTPSLGGISLDAEGAEIYAWTSGVSFQLMKISSSADTLIAGWKMKYGVDSLTYTYKFYISAKTLVIGVSSEDSIAPEFLITRCENALSPQTIPIPYLPLFNVLYTNNVFVSMFFDWENTNASEIYPEGNTYSPTSVFYAQDAKYDKNSNGVRNKMNEKIFLTASPSLSDVFPNLTNPVSPFKLVSSEHIVYDTWDYNGFTDLLNTVKQYNNEGIKNLWIIVHEWQNGGYDNMYPNVLPANAAFGGNRALINLSDSCSKYNYLFSLHENYVDFYPNASSYDSNDVARNSDGTLKTAWYNSSTGIQSYQMKPTKAANYLSIFAPQIHQTFSTTASFLDVHSSANPSGKVDFDAKVAKSASFSQTLNLYRQLGTLQRINHTGPASGEGYCHFLYAGYFDDFEAQVNTGMQNSYWQGVRLPLLADFQLNKIHPLVCEHGVGYYERFFSLNDGTPFFHQFPIDTCLMYIATELAYGNAGFIPFFDRVSNPLAVAQIEYNQVLPAQKAYANASAVLITYDDNGQAITVSQFIKNHPISFDDITSADFMSKIKIVYSNGTIVYVNRNPALNWQINPGISVGSFNYHATINSIDSLGIDSISTFTTWTLPKKSGWLVITPPTYIFNGTGNWNVESNWANNLIPPDTLPPGSQILINPVNNGSCTLNVPYTVSPGVSLIVISGKNFIIPNNLLLQKK